MESADIVDKYNLTSCATEEREKGIKKLLKDDSISHDQLVEVLLFATAPSIQAANRHQNLQMFNQ